LSSLLAPIELDTSEDLQFTYPFQQLGKLSATMPSAEVEDLVEDDDSFPTIAQYCLGISSEARWRIPECVEMK
jgi:hypothetical protein